MTNPESSERWCNTHSMMPEGAVTLLLKANANPNLQDCRLGSPLYWLSGGHTQLPPSGADTKPR